MNNLSKIGLWLNRIVLLFISVLFTIIAFRNIFNTVSAASANDIALNSATALSVAKASMGAFPLGFAILSFTSLLSNRQIFRGILTVFVLMLVTTIVRIESLQIDGHSDFGQSVLAPEIVITILSGIGIYLDVQRRKMMKLSSDAN